MSQTSEVASSRAGAGGAAGSRACALAGFYGSATVTLLAAVAHTVFPPFAFPPTAIAQSVVAAPPGAFDSFFIDRLGHWAAYLTIAGVAVAFAAAGVVVGYLVALLDTRLRALGWVAGFWLVWLLTAILYAAPAPELGRIAFASIAALLFACGVAVARRNELRISAAQADEVARELPERPETPTARSRRYFLKATGVGAAGTALGLANLGRFVTAGPDPGRKRLVAPHVTKIHPPRSSAADEAFDAIPGLSPEITPASSFYVIDKDLINPVLDPQSWRLEVTGRVSRPVKLTHADLLAMQLEERFQTLECISNQVGGDLISNGLFTGVPLHRVVDLAGPGDGVQTVIFRCAGGYTESLPLAEAMDRDTWIVVGLNGHLLPHAHGFPARLLSLGTYGMKNPKWLTGIELSDKPTFIGYWEQRGWSAGAEVTIMSRFDTPDFGQELSAPVTLAGIAFAANRGISKVEVTTDRGRTWHEAILKRELAKAAWRLWRFDFDAPGPGDYRAAVRAYDGRGNVQRQGSLDPFPRGTSGFDQVAFTVR